MIESLRSVWNLLVASTDRKAVLQKEDLLKKVRVVYDRDVQFIEKQKYGWKENIKEKICPYLSEGVFWLKQDYLQTGRHFNQNEEAKFYLMLRNCNFNFFDFEEYQENFTHEKKDSSQAKNTPISRLKKKMLFRLRCSMKETICHILNILVGAKYSEEN